MNNMKRFSTHSSSTVNGNQLLFFDLSAWRRLSLLFTGPSTKVVAGNSLQWPTPTKIHKLDVCTLTVSGSLSEFSIKQLLRIMIHLKRHHHGLLNFATYNDSHCMWYSSEFFRWWFPAPASANINCQYHKASLLFFNQASNFSTKLEFYVLQDSFFNNAEVIRRYLFCRLATMNPKIYKNICRLGSISGQHVSWMLSYLFVKDKKMSKILSRLLKVILLQEVDFVFSLLQSIQKTIIHTLSVHIRIISRNETWFKSVSLHEHQTNKSWRCLLAVSPKVASRTGFCYKTWATLQSHFPRISSALDFLLLFTVFGNLHCWERRKSVVFCPGT